MRLLFFCSVLLSIIAGLAYWCLVLGEHLHPNPDGAFFWVVVSFIIGAVAVIAGGSFLRWAAMAFVIGNAIVAAILLFITLLGGIPLVVTSIEIERVPTGIAACTFLAMAVAQLFVMKNAERQSANADANVIRGGCLISLFLILPIMALLALGPMQTLGAILAGMFILTLLVIGAAQLFFPKVTEQPNGNVNVLAGRAGWAISVVIIAAIAAYASLIVSGWIEGRSAAPTHRLRAMELHAAGRDGAALGEERLAILLRLIDPDFMRHNGMDSLTPCAQGETITQYVAWVLDGKPRGVGRLGQHCLAGYALGLETRLAKEDILALYLDHVYMGRARDGSAIFGFFKASESLFGNEPKDLSRREYLSLVAIRMRSGFSRYENQEQLDEQVLRIERLLAGKCKARYNGERHLYLCDSRRFDTEAKNR